jgi:CubicO group peptidase (beta-lactamase class C family)
MPTQAPATPQQVKSRQRIWAVVAPDRARVPEPEVAASDLPCDTVALSASTSCAAEPMQSLIPRVIAASLAIALSLTGPCAAAILLQFIIAVPAGAEPREQILALLAKHGIPGASMALIENGQIAWARGYGVRELTAADEVSATTLFQAGSISKPIAALCALILVQQGRLELDADVNARLTSWRIPQTIFTEQQPVTMRLLLSHRAGVTVHGFPGYAAGAPIPSLLQVLDGRSPANTLPIVVDTVPGSRFRYSGGGYTILQQLMMDQVGSSFPNIMDELVLRPLGMAHSTYRQPLPADQHGAAATAHQSRGPLSGKWHTYPEMAAAGLWTTAEDLARFALGVQAAWKGQSGAILTRHLAQQMLTPQGSGTYGLGLVIRGSGRSLSFAHDGINAGFESRLVAYLETGQGVAVMVNRNGTAAMLKELVELLRAEYRWPA